MSRIFRLFGGGRFCLVIAVAALLARPAHAQDTNTTASLAQLQSDLVNGITNIVLAFNTTLTTTSPLEIIEDTTIDGTGFSPVISGGGSTLIFYVDPGVHFRLINVTLSGGNNTGQIGAVGINGGNGGNTGGNGTSGGGGTNSFGGAVYNLGNCTFINCLFVTNTVTGGAGGAGGNGGNGNNTGGNGGNGGNGGLAYGGAIYNLGTLLLSNCSVAGNAATGGAGGVAGTNGSGPFVSYPGAGGFGGIGAGSGIYNAGQATIVNTTLNQNAAVGGASQAGGGVTGASGNGNTGPVGPVSEGGGLFNGGTNTLVNCTFFANTVKGGSGGMGGPFRSGSLGTGGTGGNGGNAIGGGIYNAPGALLSLTNCTFSGDAVTGGTNGLAGPGGFAGANGSMGVASGANIANGNTGATFLLKNTILNLPTNATSASGTITDQGNNLSSDATPVFTTTNSFNNKDPKLSPTGLTANNSTGALTIGLSINSPAIDAIYDNSAPLYDERNFIRPVGARSDIGAFEFGANTTNFNVLGVVNVGGLPLAGVTVSAGALSTVTTSNGSFSFSLAASNAVVITPKPLGFFSPSSTNIVVSSNNPTIIFNATNASLVLTNVGTTNTNTFSLSFGGIPNFATYRIQATTNLLTNGTVWTTIATNSASNGIPSLISGTNFTNLPRRFFRAVSP